MAPPSLPALNTEPESPYTGTVRSGTSSTYWYSSVGPEAALMGAAAVVSAMPGARVRAREPCAST